MTKKSPDDKDLFKQAMQGVTPLKSTHTISISASKNKNLQVRKVNKVSETLTEMHSVFLSDHSAENILPEEVLSYSRPGIHALQRRRLKQGQLPIDARLDLHGHTVDSARNLLIHFINSSIANGHHCVHVIHGKGHRGNPTKAILKTKVAAWLKQFPEVLAFCSAIIYGCYWVDEMFKVAAAFADIVEEIIE